MENGGAVTVEERTALEEVLRALRRVKHGYVQVIVQDGRVIQIDTTEKKTTWPNLDVLPSQG
jgi:hypothetical protein